MAEDSKTSVANLMTAVNDLRQTAQQQSLSMHANIAQTRPVDAWAAMGEAYPGSPAPAPVAPAAASLETKKSLSADYVTIAAQQAQATGVGEPMYKSMTETNMVPLVSLPLVTESILKSIQARPTNMLGARDPFSDDFYKKSYDDNDELEDGVRTDHEVAQDELAHTCEVDPRITDRKQCSTCGNSMEPKELKKGWDSKKQTIKQYMDDQDDCPHCEGSGWEPHGTFQIPNPCKPCGGSGKDGVSASEAEEYQAHRGEKADEANFHNFHSY